MTEIPKDVTDRKTCGAGIGLSEFIFIRISEKEPVQVVPGIHYFMGGIYVDEKHRTPVRKSIMLPESAVHEIMEQNRLGGKFFAWSNLWWQNCSTDCLRGCNDS